MKMFVIEAFSRNVVILCLGIISLDFFDAQDCYKIDDKTVCYFQLSETNTYMTWDDAWTVCKKNESTLPVIENQMMAEILRKHLESKMFLSGDMWLAGREIRTNVWQWLNGKPFANQTLFGNPDDLMKLYNTNAVITGKLEYLLTYARETKLYICHYDEKKLCKNITRPVPWKNGCLSTDDDKVLNLVNARNRCLYKGGDLATFEEDKDLDTLQNYSDLLMRNSQYWIGLRLNWWIWNETDSSKEIKYSNWHYHENLLSKHCLYIGLRGYTWHQDDCQVRKRFLCQTVKTVTQTHETDAGDSFSTTSSLKIEDKALQKGTLLAIIGAIIAVVIVAIIIVAIVILLRTQRDRGMNRHLDERPTEPHEMSVHPIEKKSVTSKTIEVDDMSNHYAEIPRVVDHDDNDECRDEPQPGILYAALEFEANKAIYDEPVMCSQQKKEASASTKVGASNENDQRGSSAGSPTQAAEGTIYANL